MQNFSYRLSRAVMSNRKLSVLVIALITAFFAWGCRNVELKTIFSDLLPADHPFVETFKDHPNFGNPLTVTIMVKRTDGDIYNVETLNKIWDLTRDVDLAPAVDHDQVISISTEKVRYAEATPFGIDTQPVMGDAPPSGPEDVEEFRRRVDKAPLARRFYISEDGTATIITATFIERLLDYGETFEYLQGLVENARDEHHEVHMAGMPALTGWVYRYQQQMLGIFALTGIALLACLILYMRNFAGVITPITTSLIAAIWGFGFVGWLGLAIEPLIMVVPLLLVARSFSHCVQFTERYYEIYLHVGDKRKAAEIALSVMMAPSMLGIFTDAAGLLLIALAPIPAMERFALFCGFWAAMLVPANVFLSPLILSFLPAPKNVRKITGMDGDHGFHAALKRFLGHIAKVTYGRAARVTTVVFLIITGVSVYEFLQMKIGNPVEGSNILWEDGEFNTAVAAINRNFPGVNTLEIVLEAKDPINPSRVARQAETIQTMSRIQYALEHMENPPEATLSFSDYLPEANRLFAGGNPKWAPLDPTNEATLAAVGAVLFGTSPKAFLHVTDFEQQNTTVSLWYKNNKQETVDLALDQARRAVELVGADHPEFRVRLATGTIALQQSINDTVAQYEYVILGALNIVILVGCSIAYRSIVAGFFLLIPVNLANLYLGAAMVEMGIGLDVNTLPIAAIGIGVGIDYGIYLLSRICEEYQATKHYDTAIRAAIMTTGKAILFTASIVAIGILPWYFLSDLKFLADMGLLLVMVMTINMVLSIVVVPLLVWLAKPYFVTRDDLLVGESVDLSQYTEGRAMEEAEMKTMAAAQ
ncbi:MMPL family transporter [Zavarzinia compransoris]|uniref:efflux RND transporter permease subunit n=1 Tax=Zavarzinia marina TaxID=2911065 RepID=UPI001F366BD1|nr:MMPL family transporter [Zavarzinia marina]MCF4165634.1 MMPL family transporter [Zavarzinia marina]